MTQELRYNYEEILNNLKVYDDEPDYESEFFNFNEYKERLAKIIKNILNINKPFAICLNGEWGSGKTSLMYRVYKKFEECSKEDPKLKVIWFDAWKYERLDPVLALLQKIISVYITRSDKLKKFLSGLLSLSADISTRRVLGLTLDEIKEHFRNTVEDIDTLDEIIAKTIGNGRLLVFIDDLDRCHIDNIIGMLEAIKILFNAKNAKFIVAVDIKKLERAWALKHNNDTNAIEEGKEHLDKIFPLRLNLPNKSKEEIDAYIDKLVGRFPEDLRDIIRVGCKANPRKIKRLMNILYVILTSLDDSDKSRFNEIFPCIVIWTIIATNFTNLANIVRNDPNTFIHSLSMPFNYLELKSNVERYKADMTRPPTTIEHLEKWNFIPIWEEALKDTALLNFDEILWKYIRYYTYVRLVERPDDNIILSVGIIINGDIENVNTQLNDRLNNDDLRKQFNSMCQRYSMQLADNLQHVINNTKLFL